MAAYLPAIAFACFLAAGAVYAAAAGDNAHMRRTPFRMRPARREGVLSAMEVAIDHDRVCLETLDSAAISGAAAASRSRFPDFSKRTLDIVLSVVMIVFLTPLLAATAIAIKLDSPGPVLYRQKRVGLGGKVFEVYKFRSMFVDAERDGPQYARIGDERITRVGRIIRRLRIDEIPQTLNVLNGKMSFVGPRPERPEFVATLEKEIPHYHARHLVKPGITGWAQVKYEYAASVEGAREKLRYDLYYVTAVSPLLDLAIVAMTVRVVLFGLGSR